MNNITVTMPIEEYERLKEIERQHNQDINILEHCSNIYYECLDTYQDEEKAKRYCLTSKLLNRIKEIYC